MLITFEGIEGSGKTTQIGLVAEWLQKKGYSVLSTREPGGTEVGEKIRSLLLNRNLDGIIPEAELLLYMADRLQHIQTVILPGLKEKRVVLCDRFYDATLAYQGFARGLDRSYIHHLHEFICHSLKPYLTFLLDLPPEDGLKRAWKEIRSGNRIGSETRFEEEALSFHVKVREGYLMLAEEDPERFRVIDGRLPPGLVREQIVFEIEKKMKPIS